jgi:hypothetical protein
MFLYPLFYIEQGGMAMSGKRGRDRREEEPLETNKAYWLDLGLLFCILALLLMSIVKVA